MVPDDENVSRHDDPRRKPHVNDGLDVELEQSLGFRPHGGEW